MARHRHLVRAVVIRPLEFRYALQSLDALHHVVPEAPAELARLGAFVPESGSMPVAGEPRRGHAPPQLRPDPGWPIRQLFSEAVVEAELDRLAAEQREDGGRGVDWNSWSPAGEFEWGGWATVLALKILRANCPLS